MNELQKIAEKLVAKFPGLSLATRLQAVREAVPGRLVFTSSLGPEDQVILAAIAQTSLDIEIVTLDTGRLFSETYELWAETEARYGVAICSYFPDAQAVENLIRQRGVNGFYQSVEARKACCSARKIEPLARALEGAAGWITGLRADASEDRANMQAVQVDVARGLIKFSPLFDWSRPDVLAETEKKNIPVNVLHKKGFVSIGCAPCTRAIGPNEPERAGRWWWEQEIAAECGLHVDADHQATSDGAGSQSASLSK